MIEHAERLMRLLRQQRLIAIIRLEDLTQAVQLSKALLQGGVRIQEYTMTNPSALQAIAEVKSRVPAFSNGEAQLGVGSVRNVKQVTDAVKADVDFVVTPTLSQPIVERCYAEKIPVLSGAFSPTEIANAWELGSSAVKVFPASVLGPGYIKDVLAPMPELRLLPTGGINLSNLEHYFTAGAAAVGVGGSLVNRKAVAGQDWKKISELAAAYSEKCNVTE